MIVGSHGSCVHQPGILKNCKNYINPDADLKKMINFASDLGMEFLIP